MADSGDERVADLAALGRALWSGLPAFLLVYDRRGRVLDVNRIAPGFRRSDVVGTLAEELMTPDVRDEFRETLGLVFADGVTRDVPQRDAQGRRYKLRLVKLPDPEQVLGIAVDREDLSKAREDLAERTARYQAVVEQAAEGIFVTASDGTYLDANPTGLALLGYNLEELAALKFADCVEPADLEAHPLRHETLTAGSVEERVRTLRRRDGSSLVAQISTKRLDDGSVLLVARDVTEQRAAEALIQRQHEQQASVARLGLLAAQASNLDQLFDQALQELTADLDVQLGKVLDLAADGRSLLLRRGVGWDPGLVGSARVDTERGSQAGFTLLSRMPVVVEDLLEEQRFHGPPLLLKHAVRSGISVVIPRGDGVWGVLAVHSRQPRKFADHDAAFVQSVANVLGHAIARREHETALLDAKLSLERRVEDRTAELSQVNAELDAFAYSVAHDLRAPLRCIEGYSAALQEDQSERLDAEGVEFLQRIEASAANMNRLIQDLLILARMGRSPVALKAVSLDGVVKDALLAVHAEVQQSGANIDVRAPLGSVAADRNMLGGAVLNLITNAIKFVVATQSPQICIESEARGDRIRLWVRDQGIGIAPEHQEQVFEPFKRLHGSETYGGTGVGLAIVRRACEKLGGRVGVESSPGAGSSFWIELQKS